MLILTCLKQLIHRLWVQEQGATLVYVTITLPVLLGIAGLAIDGSNLFVQRQRMQTAADAAALAAARVIALGQTMTQVNSDVTSLATQNGSDTVTWSYIQSGQGVQVQTTHTFDTFFATVFGFETLTVTATASANVSVVTSADNLLPMSTMCDDMSNDADPGFTYDVEYTLWDDDKNAPGSTGWLDWNGGSNSASELAANIADPSNSGTWKIGDWIPSAPGDKNSSAVRAALDTWIGKAVTIPLFDQVTANGSNTQYRVCSFAEFILTGYDFQGSNKWVKGKFVRTVERGGSIAGNPPAFGVNTVRLSQ